jgi:PEP-CTERM motif
LTRRKNMRKMTKLMLALALPAAIFAGSAHAVKITQFSYENQFGFTAFTGTGVSVLTTNTQPNFALGTAPVNPAFGSATTLAWGTDIGNGQSKFRVSDSTGIPTNGQVTGVETVDDAVFVPDLSLFHDNFTIADNARFLTSAQLTGALLLNALTPPTGDEIGPLIGIFSILFKETTNNPAGGGACADGAAEPCPDIFVLDAENSSPLTNIFLGTIDEFSYFLDVDLSGLVGVGPESCAAVGQAFPCFGFITEETATSQLNIQFQIRSVENVVPEPGVLALLGLGLAGLGFGQLRRRK